LQTTSEPAPSVECPVVEPKEEGVEFVDLERVFDTGVKSKEQEMKEVEMFNKLKKLDYAVEYACSKKIEWLEVDQDILEHFYKGPVPEVGYYIYKTVKLCLKGRAEALAKRDNLSCHEILFPKESYMKVGVRRAGG